MRRILSLLGLAGLLAAVLVAAAMPAPRPAFTVGARVADDRTVALRFDIAPGYSLYRDRFDLRIAQGPDGARLGPVEIPRGLPRRDESSGADVELLAGQAELRIPIVATDGSLRLEVGYQGCTELGVCMAPRHGVVEVTIRAGRLSDAIWRDDVAPPAVATPAMRRIETTLQSGSLWLVAAVFLGAGVLLSLTPCLLPMVPILASIIAGHEGPVSRGRGMALAGSYTLGMALIYTALGIAAGLLGEGLAGLLQNRRTLGAFALVLVMLSLSMFGAFELQLSPAWQSGIGALSNRLPGGRMTGVFLMGGLSALLVGPCVAPPLAAALLFIGRTQDVALGGLALFCLAIGMGVPLLAVGASAGALLPKAGAWSGRIKPVLGVLLLGVAAWMIAPVLPASVLPRPDPPGFTRLASAAEFDARLRDAGRPVVVFFYADWCLTCAQLERITLRDDAVRQRLEAARRLRVDLTESGETERALLRRFGLFGPPAILVFGSDGREILAARVVGFAEPKALLAAIAEAGI